MNKIRKISFLLVVLMGFQFLSCSDTFLNQPAKGALLTSQLLNKAGVEQVLIGAYSALKGSKQAPRAGDWVTGLTNWVYGSVVGAETFKGSNSGDQSDINPLSTFTASPTNSYLRGQWISLYDGINRANTTLKLLAQLPAGAVSDADKTRITAEARFLRGVFFMEAKMMWNMVPWVDESIDYAKGNYKIANTEDIMPKIIADFDFAYTNLAETASQKGRANKWAAAAFKAKALIYSKDWTNAYTLLQTIIASGKTAGGTPYGLNAKFRDAFDATFDNSAESVFAIQASVNDGSGAGNANPDLVLNYTYLSSAPVGCCGFNQPTFDLANSYRTLNGLPLLDGSHNSAANKLADEDWMLPTPPTSVAADAKPLDPRIDWVLGRTGIPYFDWGTYTGPPWVRLLADGGPYTPKKYTFPKTEIGTFTDGSSWTPGYNAVNQYVIRFADVLLWAAEAAVEKSGPDLVQAQTYVNMIRARVQDPKTWVKISDDATKSDWQAYLDPTIPSHNAGNYVINLYGTGGDVTFATAAGARAAIHMERYLELALEGHRFFDLVRWGETTGTTGHTLQTAINYNGTLNNLAKNVTFKAGQEYYPIPQDQIDLNQVDGVSVLKQNSSYFQ